MTLLTLPLPLQRKIKQLLTDGRFVEAKVLRDAWLQVRLKARKSVPLAQPEELSRLVASFSEQEQLCMN